MKLFNYLKQKDKVCLVEPSDNLEKAYMEKAKNSLQSMNLNFKNNNNDWAISSAYYARYFAIYSLFAKIGIKSEIHDCTILLVKELFIKKEFISKELYGELEKAKDQRIDLQYYVDRIISQSKVEENINKATNFVLEIKKIAEKITDDLIKEIRKEFTKLQES